mmetsp:Transcript_5422/g.9776  ORF Transcript_5422/g.9776 Transcript_5422/m.9776 type:complete len:560 (-) Transcript_5422:397-2076(-)
MPDDRKGNHTESSAAAIGETIDHGFWKMYHKFNLFPEYVEKDTKAYAYHGCRQTTVFGVIGLVLLLSLTIYYGLQKHNIAKVQDNPDVQSVSQLFDSNLQPYCECSSPLIQYGNIATLTFATDSLCNEIKTVWPIVSPKTSSYWDGATFKGVLRGLYDVCNTIDVIRDGVYERWQESHFTSVTLFSRSQLNQILSPQGESLKNMIADTISSSFKLSETFNLINAPAGYTTDAQPFPSAYDDSWGHHPRVADVHNYTVLSLSKIAAGFKKNISNYTTECDGVNLYSTSGVTDQDLQCYFHFWEGKTCQSEYDVLVHIVSNGALLGETTTTGGSYDFDLDFYCGATQTLKNFPTKALASQDFWSWSTFGDPAFGDKMNQSSYGNISAGIDQAFITGVSTSVNYDSYFSSCSTKKCSYVENEHLSSGALVLLIFGLMGGFISVLQIFVPIMCAPCAPDDDDDVQNMNKRSANHSKRLAMDDVEMDGKSCRGSEVAMMRKSLDEQIRELREMVMRHDRKLATAPEAGASPLTSSIGGGNRSLPGSARASSNVPRNGTPTSNPL